MAYLRSNLIKKIIDDVLFHSVFFTCSIKSTFSADSPTNYIHSIHLLCLYGFAILAQLVTDSLAAWPLHRPSCTFLFIMLDV